jgi:Sulfotransferase family
MIVSLEHRFIFAAIPKTGTHAVRRALREHMGSQDMEQVGLFVQRKLPIPELAEIRHGHLTLQQVRRHLSAEDFDGFFKFAFVRNPFDRFVSYCAFMTRAEGQFERDPKGVMRHFLANPPARHILFQPQHTFVTDPDRNLLSDDLGRVEEMQQSYDRIATRIGIPSQPLEKVNASSRRDYRQYYDQPLIDGVARLYSRDLELFGYEF